MIEAVLFLIVVLLFVRTRNSYNPTGKTWAIILWVFIFAALAGSLNHG